MKQLIFILLAIIILSCDHNYKKSDLIGTWEAVFATDIETGEVEFPPEDEEVLIVEFKLDSLYVNDGYDDEIYAWQIKGDTILMPNASFNTVIKELTADKLTVEVDFMKVTQLTFRKIK